MDAIVGKPINIDELLAQMEIAGSEGQRHCQYRHYGCQPQRQSVLTLAHLASVADYEKGLGNLA